MVSWRNLHKCLNKTLATILQTCNQANKFEIWDFPDLILFWHNDYECDIGILIYYLIIVKLKEHPHNVLFSHISTLLITTMVKPSRLGAFFLIQLVNNKVFLFF